MDDFFSPEALNLMMTQFQAWAMLTIFSWSSIGQIVTIVSLIIGAWAASRKLSVWITTQSNDWDKKKMMRRWIRLLDREILLIIIAPLVLWLAIMIATTLKWPTGILNSMANLVNAGAVIRLVSRLVKNRTLSKTLAFSIWIIAGLNMAGVLDIIQGVLENTIISMGDYKFSIFLLIKGVVTLVILLWIADAASNMLEGKVERSHLPSSQKVLFYKLARIFFITIATLFGLNTVGVDLTSLAVFTGALGIGIGFGLQKIFTNLISGFILLMDKSIKPGDVIGFSNTYGVVNRLGARYVSILTNDGKEHLIPNELIITQPVENWSYTDEKVRIHISIAVSYTTDLSLVKSILLQIAKAHTRILKNPEPLCIISELNSSSITVELCAWIEDPVNGIINVRSDVYEEVLRLFKLHGVEIAYSKGTAFDMNQVKEIIGLMKKSVE